MNNIYLDNAATTALRPEVLRAMTKTLETIYGNPSSTHSFGRESKAILEQCRKSIAKVFNAEAAEIIFTSGGTEADNLALRSAVRDLGVKSIITTHIEHHAVLHTAEQLAREYDIEICYLNLDANGQPLLDHLEVLLAERDQVLVSLMHVNNEIGNLLDINRVAQICKNHNALFHSDMVQSVGHFNIDIKKTPIDFFAASAHKFHGPKGVGFCYVRRQSGLKAQIFGGEQERGLRAGTEGIHNIVGMDKAMQLAYENLESEKTYIKELKHYFINALKRAIPKIQFNGLSADLENSTYTLLNVRLPLEASRATLLQFQLDLKGVACSKGSACQSGSVGQSHVLQAILNKEALAQPSLRFSLSCFNHKEELEEVVQILADFIND
jgi:cysteine desulfurase